METIRIYIDNLFRDMPDNEEVHRARQNLLDSMEDKYSELKAQGKSENEAIGIVISEFGNIDELREELGTDKVHHARAEKKSLSMNEVKEFITATLKYSRKIALGVVLCILSVVPLIVLGGVSEKYTRGNALELDLFSNIKMTDNIAAGVGLIIMFIMIAVAVALFIISGLQYEKYNYLKKEDFFVENDIYEYVRSKREHNQKLYSVKTVIGVVLCILSVIPIWGVVLFGEENEGMISIISVALLFIIIAIAVFLLITAGMQKKCLETILNMAYATQDREGNGMSEEYEGQNYEEDKNSKKRMEKLGKAYWSIVTVIYMTWSLLGMDWGRSWVVWPIAGILYGAIVNIFDLKVSK